MSPTGTNNMQLFTRLWNQLRVGTLTLTLKSDLGFIKPAHKGRFLKMCQNTFSFFVGLKQKGFKYFLLSCLNGSYLTTRCDVEEPLQAVKPVCCF